MPKPISRRELWITLGIAGLGMLLCLTAVVAFLYSMQNNELPWDPTHGAREHYLAVGRSYSQGFAVGFFLCFFMAMIGVAVAPRLQRRRAATKQARESGSLGVTPIPAQAGSHDRR